MRNFSILTGLMILVSFAPRMSAAHDVYKEPLEERYNLKTVSCKSCHPNNKDRSIHNKFGQYFADMFKDKNITQEYEAAKKLGEEAQQKYEQQMINQFKEALKIVEKKQMTIEDMIKAGLLNGTRLNEQKK